MKIILLVIALVICVFFLKSIVRFIVWILNFLMENIVYVLIIIALALFLMNGCE